MRIVFFFFRLTILRRSLMKHISSRKNGIKEDERINIKMLPNKTKFSTNTATGKAGKYFPLLILIIYPDFISPVISFYFLIFKLS